MHGGVLTTMQEEAGVQPSETQFWPWGLFFMAKGS